MTASATQHPLQPLLCAAREGDAEALNCLLARSRSQVIRYAERHCAVNDVEDAVQETLILTARYLNALRVLEAFNGWLFRIVKRECNRYKRLKRSLLQVPITEDIEGPYYPESKGLARDVAKALESLPAHYREIILLRDLDGLSLEELCSKLGLSLQAAKARLHRARSLAREYLAA